MLQRTKENRATYTSVDRKKRECKDYKLCHFSTFILFWKSSHGWRQSHSKNALSTRLFFSGKIPIVTPRLLFRNLSGASQTVKFANKVKRPSRPTNSFHFSQDGILPLPNHSNSVIHQSTLAILLFLIHTLWSCPRSSQSSLHSSFVSLP